MKRLASFVVVVGLLALAMGGAGCTIGPAAPGGGDTLTILHTNDMHGTLEGEKLKGGQGEFINGGLPYVAGTIAGLRQAAKGPVLVLDAGDIWQGTLASNQTRGEVVIEAMNLAGYNATVPGNHDFDHGQEVLKARIAQSRFPWLAANIIETATGQPPFGIKPYIVQPVGSLKVGIIGLGYPGTPAISRPVNVAGLQFLDGIESVKKVLPEVQAQADVIVVLSHLGFDGDQALANAVPGIHVIVGGHSHTIQQNARIIGNTIILQAGSYTKYVGNITLKVDKTAKTVTPVETKNVLVPVVSTKFPAHPEVDRLVKARLEAAKDLINKPVGETLIDLENCYEGECPLGNLVADAMLAANQAGDRPADAAMHNNAGLRARIPKGPINYGQIYAVLPFENVLAAIDLTGADLLKILERTVSGRRGNLVVAGMTYQYDWSKPAGSRIVSVTIGGKPLDPQKVYRIQTIDYLASGGDGQETFKNGKNIVFGESTADVVAEYIRQHSPVNPKVEGRITGN